MRQQSEELKVCRKIRGMGERKSNWRERKRIGGDESRHKGGKESRDFGASQGGYVDHQRENGGRTQKIFYHGQGKKGC